ncbi:YbaK/EbsC family protein [Histidinibacterium aquaticum]|uniref:YbaK/EbsC family protein n=1 Tax=Histidinibacterium aquaticum TaxID=2613962 RepID=A0A5J5GKT2_9RHOB|nr:YbaK/EbsC family protein [Histidinibacterium aquaticum]KAA9008740.1 YbaK/EbsC family protein [Histidinibacterium aquaticum]
MSKSLKRVKHALEESGIGGEVLEMSASTKTADQAAEAAGCELDQIVKSIIFRGEETGEALLFLTAGGNRVSAEKAALIAGEPLGRADAALVRSQTGFAIGGVAPIGHLNPIRTFWDARLSEFDVIYAAAGTPNHIFAASPDDLKRVSGAVPGDFTD